MVIVLYILLFLLLLSILIFINCNDKHIINCKEDLTIPTYSQIYVNAINASVSALTSGAVSGCATVASNVSTLQTNVTTAISTANGYISSLTSPTPLLTNTTNLINNVSQTAFNNLNTWQMQLNVYYNNINPTTLTPFVRTLTWGATNSTLNGVYGPWIYNIYTYYNAINSTSNTGYSYINSNYSSLTANISTLNTLKTNLLNSQSSLTSLQSAINTQITNCNTGITKAQTSLTNVSNYSNTTAIQSALGVVYNNAQASVNKYTVGTEQYKQANEYLRFLLNPENLVNDINNVDQINTLNNNISNADFLNAFFAYFVQNNIKVQNIDIFNPMNTNITNSKAGPKQVYNNISTVFNQLVSTVKANNIAIANNALSSCNSSSTTLSSLLSQVTICLSNISTALTSINNLISSTIISTTNQAILTNTQTVLNNMNRNVFEIVNSPYTNVYSIPNKFLYSSYELSYPTNAIFYNQNFIFPDSYPNTYTPNPLLYTIKTSGVLTSFYIFIDINTISCLYTGTCGNPQIQYFIVPPSAPYVNPNISSLDEYLPKYFNISGAINISSLYNKYGYEELGSANTQVNAGDMLYLYVTQNSTVYCCNVFAQDVQIMFNIKTS